MWKGYGNVNRPSILQEVEDSMWQLLIGIAAGQDPMVLIPKWLNTWQHTLTTELVSPSVRSWFQVAQGQSFHTIEHFEVLTHTLCRGGR